MVVNMMAVLGITFSVIFVSIFMAVALLKQSQTKDR